MGDRGNIVIHENEESEVFLYTHWEGRGIEDVARRALQRKQRWDDPQYLARIVFCELIGDDTSGADGFGISAVIGDNSHDLIVIDTTKQTVRKETEERKVLAEVSIADFAEQGFPVLG